MDDENSPYVKIYDSIRLNLRDPLVFIAPKLDPILKHFRPSRAELSRGVDQLNALLLSMAQKRREQIQQRRAHGKHDTPDHQKDLLTLILEGELDGAPGLSTDEELRVCTTLYIYKYITRHMLSLLHPFRVTWQFSS